MLHIFITDMIYAIGGSDGTNLNSAECYNVHSGQWTSISSMSEHRKYPGAAAIGGKIYAVGGCDSTSRHNSVECYDPSTDQWTRLAPMLSCRSGLGLAVLDGFLYALGGYDGNTYLSSSERYDPLSDEWTMAPNMFVPRDCVGVTVVTLQYHNTQAAVNKMPTVQHTRQHSS